LLCTTLLDKKRYTRTQLSNLYHKRWNIEELYKTSKEILKLESLHSKKERGVKQEVYANFTLINIARLLEITTILKNKIKRDTHQINFKGCLAGLAKYINDIFYKVISNIHSTIVKMVSFVTKLKSRLRPNRRYPRISYKPRKNWNDGGQAILKNT
jgi:hypothetical protein